MVLDNVTEADGGQYWCHASNNIGENVTKMDVQVAKVNIDTNHVDCCSNANVSQECMGLCRSEQITYQSLTSHPQCLSQYSEILKCAMTGVEVDNVKMLKCCWDQGVSHHCDGWCHNLPSHIVSKFTLLPQRVVSKDDEEFCAISFSRQIIGCIDQQRQKKIDNTTSNPHNIAPLNSKIVKIHTKTNQTDAAPSDSVEDNDTLWRILFF